MTDITTSEAPATPADRRPARENAPATGHAAASQVDWLFDAQADQPLTTATLASIGLSAGPLAGVRLELARVAQSGRWHLDPASITVCCPRLARATERGRSIHAASIGLLDGISLCRWCARHLAAPGLVLPGAEGAYLALAQYLAAAHVWVTTWEAAAPSADWLACSRWAARTPFTGPGPLSALLAALPGHPPWADHAAAAEAAWKQLSERATAARERARQAAGPPGYRAMAACARALAGAAPSTRRESRLLDASAGRPATAGGRAWTIASAAWLRVLAAGGDLGAAGTALAAALHSTCRIAQAPGVALLPSPATSPGEPGLPASRARAEHHALRHGIARRWSQRLTDCLASVLGQDHDRDWQLLRIAGWPITGELDHDLAYLAAYPELARIPDPGCGDPCGRGHASWIVVLHVPRFAATHAAIHVGAHLDITPGPPLPARATPADTRLRSLLHDDPCHWPARASRRAS